MTPNHDCYVSSIKNDPIKDEKRWNKYKIYYYDFETDSSDHILKPIMVVYSNEDGTFKNTLKGDSCLSDFCNTILRKKYKNSIFMAHNGGRFDMYFLLKYIFDIGETPDVLYNGGTILYIYLPSYKIMFKDTYQYLPRALSFLPKMFNIEGINKTFFPHMLSYNTYHNYIGEYPDISAYDVDNMSNEKRLECIKWVTNKKNKGELFNYIEKMEEYCINDVEVLRKCSEHFRKMFKQYGNVDPFIDGITLSHSVSIVYRKLHMPEKSIALIPPFGYKAGKRYSAKAINWLHYISKTSNITIQHARNGGEKKLIDLGIYVDGFIKSGNNGSKGVVLEFLGCFFHGCTNCYSSKSINTLNGKTMEQLQEEYLTRKALILKNGYQYREIWEHDYDLLLKDDTQLKEISETLIHIEPLSPKECLYGGRTEAFVLYKNCTNNEEIKYIDVNSLYPYVQKTKIFPKGHPDIILYPSINDLNNWFGLIKCKILAPSKLWLPVLPIRSNNKLMFGLCKKCIDFSVKTNCNHSVEERSWIGSYTTVEINEAIKKGYTILEIYEVWNWPKEKQSNNLFKQFIETFLKMKLIGAGYPSDNMSDKDKEDYIQNVFIREQVKLNKNDIIENPALKNLGKLCLNSLWGKLCQALNKDKTVYITEPSKFFNIILNEENKISSVSDINEKMMEITYKLNDNFSTPNSFSNYALGAFVTSYARCHLYKYMDMVGDKLLYCDTDSIVYVSNLNDIPIETGPYLGQMSCEILSTHKVNDSIQTWVSTGPKSYAYKLKVNSDISAVKCKGITLNFNTSKLINFDYMSNLVSGQINRNECKEIPYPNQIIRDKKNTYIKQKNRTKNFKFTFDKRKLCNDMYSTTPYGYCD